MAATIAKSLLFALKQLIIALFSSHKKTKACQLLYQRMANSKLADVLRMATSLVSGVYKGLYALIVRSGI